MPRLWRRVRVIFHLACRACQEDARKKLFNLRRLQRFRSCKFLCGFGLQLRLAEPCLFSTPQFSRRSRSVQTGVFPFSTGRFTRPALCFADFAFQPGNPDEPLIDVFLVSGARGCSENLWCAEASDRQAFFDVADHSECLCRNVEGVHDMA